MGNNILKLLVGLYMIALGLIMLFFFSGCITDFHILTRDEKYEIQAFVKEKLGVPATKNKYFTTIMGDCDFDVRYDEYHSPKSKMVGYYQAWPPVLCFDGMDDEIYAHEVAHAYGADEKTAKQIGWDWINRRK